MAIELTVKIEHVLICPIMVASGKEGEALRPVLGAFVPDDEVFYWLVFRLGEGANIQAYENNRRQNGGVWGVDAFLTDDNKHTLIGDRKFAIWERTKETPITIMRNRMRGAA